MRLVHTTALAMTALLSMPADAAQACHIRSPHGVSSPAGGTVTMDVDNNGRPCTDSLWVQPGVVPFTWLEKTKAPRHGDLMLDQPTSFTYRPDNRFGGRDSFDIIAHGNSADGVPVTARVHVNVRVATLPRGEAWDPRPGINQGFVG